MILWSRFSLELQSRFCLNIQGEFPRDVNNSRTASGITEAFLVKEYPLGVAPSQ